MGLGGYVRHVLGWFLGHVRHASGLGLVQSAACGGLGLGLEVSCAGRDSCVALLIRDGVGRAPSGALRLGLGGCLRRHGRATALAYMSCHFAEIFLGGLVQWAFFSQATVIVSEMGISS